MDAQVQAYLAGGVQPSRGVVVMVARPQGFGLISLVDREEKIYFKLEDVMTLNEGQPVVEVCLSLFLQLRWFSLC